MTTYTPAAHTPSPSIEDNFTERLYAAAMADNTRRAYAEGWAEFEGWCGRHGIVAMRATPTEVRDFFVSVAGRRRVATNKPLAFGTLMLWRCAIRRAFADANRASPTHHPEVTAVFKGLARLRGTRQRQVHALREDQLAAILALCPNTPIGMRDAAMLALGFAAALRRSELCGLQMGDIEWTRGGGEALGIIVHVRRSKTDQAGAGQRVAVPFGTGIQPVARLERWLGARGRHAGHLFQSLRRDGKLTGNPLHHSDIPRLVKRYAAAIGLNPKEFSAHSLRAGFVTSAAAHHARLDKIMAVTRHTSTTTLMKYIRDANAFSDHAGAGFL